MLHSLVLVFHAPAKQVLTVPRDYAGVLRALRKIDVLPGVGLKIE
jgi:hypothetical protein